MNKKGFTLIELLAVIIILGILMIIAIPSVTSYINNSRKSAYVDTAKEIISGARNFVNEGKLEMYATDTTYYIPASCINTENGQKSPYGEFVQAYVLVTFNGNGYKYYWVSRDETGQGVKDPIEANELKEDDIESDIPIDYIKTNVIKDGTSNTKVIDESLCNSFEKTAADSIKEKSSSQLISLDNNIYLFKGSNPSNYVTFNGEPWRIIGIYGDQLKIQRVGVPNNLTNFKFYNSEYFGNSWSSSELYYYLRSPYYNTLSTDAQNMTDYGIWYVGASLHTDTAQEALSNAMNRTYEAKIGVMATYELLYASNDENCYEIQGNAYNSSCGLSSNNWMNPHALVWTVNPYADYSTYSMTVSSDGTLFSNNVTSSLSAIPAVFLKSSIKIASGDGTSGSPYILQ